MSPADPKKALVPYLRQSQRGEGDVSVEQQWDAITGYARGTNRKLTVNSLEEATEAGLVERDVSGNKHWWERSVGRAIERCAKGEASGVVAYDQKRLSREDQLGTAEIWSALQAIGAQFHDATGGGEVNRMLFGIKSEMAHDEWEEARKRGIDSAYRATLAGKHVGATPIGYVRVDKYTPDANPADYGKLRPDGDPAVPSTPAGKVRQMFVRRAAGCTDRELMNLLNELPASSRRNAADKRGRSAARGLISRRTYMGVVGYGPVYEVERRLPKWLADSLGVPEKTEPAMLRDRVEVENAHEPIIDPATWQRAQRERQRGRKSRRNDILHGLVRCHLGHRMSVSSNQNGLFWRCGNDTCEQPARINHRNLQRLVVGQVLDHYLGVFERPPDPEDRTPELEAAVAEARSDLADVEAHVADYRPAAYGAALSVAMDTVEEAERDLAEYTPPRIGDVPRKAILVKLRETAEVDNEAAVEQIRGLCQRALKEVTVLPGRAPAEERVILDWQDGARTGAVTSDRQAQDLLDEAFDQAETALTSGGSGPSSAHRRS